MLFMMCQAEEPVKFNLWNNCCGIKISDIIDIYSRANRSVPKNVDLFISVHLQPRPQAQPLRGHCVELPAGRGGKLLNFRLFFPRVFLARIHDIQ